MFQSNEDRIVKSLETIAECQLKQTEMAREAMKKSQMLFEANMAMMRESQIKIKPNYEKYKVIYKDCPLQTADSDTPTMDDGDLLKKQSLKPTIHDECEDETNEEGDDMPF